MINKILKYGKGSGAKAVSYLLNEERHTIPPKVIKGNPEITQQLCETNPHKWKYTSGVLSFCKGKIITEEMKIDIITEAEKTFFGDLNANQYNILWVEHTDKNRSELHYLIPRIEMTTGKSLNIAPPGKRKIERFDSFRNYINKKYDLADPDSAERKQAVKKSSLLAKNGTINDGRIIITETILEEIKNGKINSYEEVKQYIEKEFGFEIKRETKSGLSFKHPEKNINVRLKGSLFTAENWQENCKEELNKYIHQDNSVKPQQISVEELMVLKNKLEKQQNIWSKYLYDRYGIKNEILCEDIKNEHTIYTTLREATTNIANITEQSKQKDIRARIENDRFEDDYQKQVGRIRELSQERCRNQQRRNFRYRIKRVIIGFETKIDKLRNSFSRFSRVKIQKLKIKKLIRAKARKRNSYRIINSPKRSIKI